MEPTSFDKQQEDFDKWCGMWDKAQDDGTFDNLTPEDRYVPLQNTADHSYFGPVDTHPTDDIKTSDAQYWQDVKNASDNQSDFHYGNSETPEVINESKKVTPQYSKTHPTSPNPIKTGTAGMDQDVHEPKSLDHTFGAEDINELHELKSRLHELQDKMNKMEGNAESGSGFESKIDSIWKQIDNLSNEMGKVLEED